jgi:N-acetylmuramoyl-L-alanine amidase
VRCPFAQWRGPIPNMTPGGMEAPVVGVVFHIMGASMAAADGWFHNPNAQASAHFGIGQDGALVQWVDTDDRAWHAMAANRHWIGVETEGVAGPLSEAGCQTFGRLYAWLAGLYHLPFVPTDDPVNGAGLGWHGMGGNAWGGHFYCPGDPRKIQRQHILDIASGQPGPPAPPAESWSAIPLDPHRYAIV